MADRFIDPVVAEVHAIREAMLQSAGGDVRILMEQVAERQRVSQRQIIREPLRKSLKPLPPVTASLIPAVDAQASQSTG